MKWASRFRLRFSSRPSRWFDRGDHPIRAQEHLSPRLVGVGAQSKALVARVVVSHAAQRDEGYRVALRDGLAKHGFTDGVNPRLEFVGIPAAAKEAEARASEVVASRPAAILMGHSLLLSKRLGKRPAVRPVSCFHGKIASMIEFSISPRPGRYPEPIGRFA